MRTIHRIGANYYHFGRCILDDKDGDLIEAIVLFKHYHPESIVSHTLHLWLQGKGRRPETWDTLLKCLREILLHRLADDIEIALGRQPGKDGPQNHEDAPHVMEPGGKVYILYSKLMKTSVHSFAYTCMCECLRILNYACHKAAFSQYNIIHMHVHKS